MKIFYSYSYLLLALSIIVFLLKFIPNLCNNWLDINNCDGSNYSTVFSITYFIFGVIHLISGKIKKTNSDNYSKIHFLFSILVLLTNQTIIGSLNPDRASIEFITIISYFVYLTISAAIILTTVFNFKK